MAGEAKTNAFMLGTATVMLGEPADLFSLTPAANSIGLVKNFSLTADSGYTELTQGTRNQVVFSVKTSNKIMATMEAYEYTGANLTYALGLEGYSASPAVTTSTTVVASGSTALVINVLSAAAAGLAPGDYISIQTGTQDNVLIRKIASLATNAVTLDVPLPAAPTADGATVKQVNPIPIGSKTDDAILAAYIVGTIADGTEVAILLPKIRVTKGFNLAFNSNDFQNMPLEFTVYDLTPEDAHYARFAEYGDCSAMLLTSK